MKKFLCLILPPSNRSFFLFNFSLLFVILSENEALERKMKLMDIWTKLYEQAKVEYHPTDVSPFIHAHHVVCALEALDGQIYTGFCFESCCGVLDLCAERVAALNMYAASGQTVIKRIITFREDVPEGISGMPCGGCRELLLQLSPENKETEIMLDYKKRKTIRLIDLTPHWWGWDRYRQTEKEGTEV